MTQTTKPTGGKWVADKNNVRADTGEIIGSCNCPYVPQQADNANAAAICAALNNTYGKRINPESVPMMMEALKVIASQSKMCEAADLIDIAQAAINAAQQ